MARNTNNRNNDDNRVSGKVRFIMFEAEINDGTIGEITQLIANAVRPVTIIQQVAPVPITQLPMQARNQGSIPAAPVSDESTAAETVAEATVPVVKPKVPSSSRGERKAVVFKGKPDDTIEWGGNGTPFESYMKQKNPEESSKKYMVIVAWFKLHGGRESVDGHDIWNAYRFLGWTPLADITQPFRSAMDSGYWVQPTRGKFAITKIGMEIVDKMGAERPVS